MNTEQQTPPAVVLSTAQLAIQLEELRVIADMTVRLTELRQKGCGHLAVENAAPEIMRKLLTTLAMHKQGFINGDDIFAIGAAQR